MLTALVAQFRVAHLADHIWKGQQRVMRAIYRSLQDLYEATEFSRPGGGANPLPMRVCAKLSNLSYLVPLSSFFPPFLTTGSTMCEGYSAHR